MKNEKMFETASIGKFRFPFRGVIKTEDLWDLSVEDLDFIFKTLNSQVKETNEESLLGVKTQQDQEINVKIEIVKYIVSIKLEEYEARSKEKEKKEQKQKILEILSDKQNQELKNKSVDELKSMLGDLDDGK